MASTTILMSNLGYMRGINGGLAHYLLYAHRHLYCPVSAQQQTLQQLRTLMEKAQHCGDTTTPRQAKPKVAKRCCCCQVSVPKAAT